MQTGDDSHNRDPLDKGQFRSADRKKRNSHDTENADSESGSSPTREPPAVIRKLRKQLMSRRRSTDDRSVMIRDLRSLLEGWDYEPGKISVRKIIGRDQKEKIQARVDLGVMQFEVGGRPDGQHPENCDSLLEFHELRLAKLTQDSGSDEGYSLTADQCRELRHEAYLYHQRYVALFVLEDYGDVERDTEHTLRIIEICKRYGGEAPDREALEGYRNYVFMMNTRARAFICAQRGEYERALHIVDGGLATLRGADDESEPIGEIDLLIDLRREIVTGMPADALPRLNSELTEALENEDYERAAKLRDRISQTQPKRGAHQAEES